MFAVEYCGKLKLILYIFIAIFLKRWGREVEKIYCNFIICNIPRVKRQDIDYTSSLPIQTELKEEIINPEGHFCTALPSLKYKLQCRDRKRKSNM